MKDTESSIRRVIASAVMLVGLLSLQASPSFTPRYLPTPVTAHPANRGIPGGAVPPIANRQTRARVSEAYAKLPMRFEANSGQVDSRVNFLSRGQGYNLYLTPTESVLTLRPEEA